MAIEYKIDSDVKFDHKLGQQVYEVVSVSARIANGSSNAYEAKTLDELTAFYKPEIINDWLKPDFAVFAYDGDRLVGTGFLSSRPDHGSTHENRHLSGMYVHPDYGGRGIGDGIWHRLVDVARQNGIKNLRAHATAFPGTLRFYEKRGAIFHGESYQALSSGTLKFHEFEIALSV